jgi:hypothetical protein
MKNFLKILLLFCLLNLLQFSLLVVIDELCSIAMGCASVKGFTWSVHFLWFLTRYKLAGYGWMWPFVTFFWFKKKRSFRPLQFSVYNTTFYVGMTIIFLMLFPFPFLGEFGDPKFYMYLVAAFLSPLIISVIPGAKQLLILEFAPKEEVQASVRSDSDK